MGQDLVSCPIPCNPQSPVLRGAGVCKEKEVWPLYSLCGFSRLEKWVYKTRGNETGCSRAQPAVTGSLPPDVGLEEAEDQVFWFPCPLPTTCAGWEQGSWEASSRSSGQDGMTC